MASVIIIHNQYYISVLKFPFYFLIYIFLFFLLAVLCSLQDLSSPTRDWTRTIGSESADPNLWIAREFPQIPILIHHMKLKLHSFLRL